MSRINSPELERKIIAFWKEEQCFEKLVEKNRGNQTWSFIDGPITANNPMGVHHAWGRTYKDLYQRYWAMNGRDLRYQNGFDCQGLWVEVEVEKELGFQSKHDIERYGIGPFIERCKERVLKFADIQTQQSIRLGYWMKWDDSYYTMSDENNYTIWRFLKKCHERGYIYHGNDAMPWCPRCGTGISQHEISSEERPLVTHVSPTVRLPILDRSGEFLLIWTTTPWTLTSNVACAVNPESTYVQVRQNGSIYYLIKERAEDVLSGQGSFEVLSELPGQDLIGLRYEGPFDELPIQDASQHQVIPWKEVSAEEGTGIVHIAPGCGKEDYELGQEFGLRPIAPIDENGLFFEDFGSFTGQFAPDVAEEVIGSLKQKGLLHKAEPYQHNYPICWRCKTELLFRMVDEWYIGMDELRHKIIDVTKKTSWIPEVGQQLEIEWLNNMHDWMISKKRYWGLALPIYLCECGTFDVIGGKEELQERAIEGWEEFEGQTPHRPWIDAVKIACPSCGKPASRIEDVGNPWLDAGIVPYSTVHYNTDRDYWSKWFPADWISESFPGQFRNWFYAILAMSTVMENREPFKQNFGYRLMKDEEGEEMHKSKGNAIDFNEAADKIGADPMRWIFASHNPDYDLRFGYHRIHDGWRQFLTLWNVYEFFITYSRIDGFDPDSSRVPVPERSLLDRWILSRLGQLVDSARLNYERYSIHIFMREVVSFIDALSRWYLRRSRRRIWKSEDDHDKKSAYQTLWQCLATLTRTLAPIIPMTSEEMYQNLVRFHSDEEPISVHLNDFPVVGEFVVDGSLIASMDTVLKLVEQGHSARSKAGVKVRQPLAEMKVVGAGLGSSANLDGLESLILDELNIKKLTFAQAAAEAYEISVRLDSKACRPKFRRDFDAVAQSLSERSAETVASEVGAGKTVQLEADGRPFELEPGDVVVEKTPAEGWVLSDGSGVLVLIDTRLTQELRREGLVRDLVRHIQKLRKEIGLQVDDRILVSYSTGDETEAAIESHRDYLANEILALQLDRTEGLDEAHDIELGEEVVQVAIAKAV